MIHRPSRNILAEALRQYVSGRITNDELDDIAIDWRDRGAIAVKEMAWGLYDDMHEHKASGEHYLNKEARHDIARWIIFLHSDQEYIWPEYSFIQIINLPINILTLGWWERKKEKKWQEFQESGDFKAWPFASNEEFEKCKARPKLLSK